MLERRGVEDDLGSVVFEDPLQGITVTNIAQHRVVGAQQAVTANGQLQRVQRRLVAVKDDQLARTQLMDLPRQLGADRAPRAGDEDDLSGYVAGDATDVGVDGTASQQIGDVELTQLLQTDATVDPFPDRGHSHELGAGHAAILRHAIHQLSAGGADRQDDQIDVLLLRDPAKVTPLAKHTVGPDPTVLLVRVIVNEPSDAVRRFGSMIDQPGDIMAIIPGAVDQGDRLGRVLRLLLVLRVQHPARQAAHQPPPGAHEQQRQRGQDERDTARKLRHKHEGDAKDDRDRQRHEGQ